MNKHAPDIRLKQSAHHRNGCSFAGAIGTEKAEDLTLVNFEREIVNGSELTITFG
jgi:hypothetical protein